MKTCIKILAVAACALAFAGSAWSADETVSGTWKSQFDSQIGAQRYTFIFKVDGTNLTGKAIGERQTGTNEVAIAEGKVDGNEISFVEPLKIQDNDIRIEYKGKVNGDELTLHRKVGDFADYDIIARRVKANGTETGGQSEPAPATNAPPTTNSPPAKP